MLVSVLITLLSASLAYFLGDWKHWQAYHTTMLYVSMMNLTYEILTYNHSLWEYLPGLIPKHTFITLLTIFVVLPTVTLIYLSHFPEKLQWQILYIACWVLGSTLIEYCITNRFIIYKNGWGIGWSLLLYSLMYLMLKLHHKRPISAYIISFICVLFFLYFFNIPFSSMK